MGPGPRRRRLHGRTAAADVQPGRPPADAAVLRVRRQRTVDHPDRESCRQVSRRQDGRLRVEGGAGAGRGSGARRGQHRRHAVLQRPAERWRWAADLFERSPVSRRVRVLIAVTIAISPAAAAGAQESGGAESLDRVRAKLEKPASSLKLQPRVPDFTVHIEKRRPMADIFDVPPWATDPVGWQPPGIGFDLMSVVRYIAAAKHRYDERVARDDVQRTIAEYCAAQPDGGAAIQICSTSRARR